MAGPGAFQVRFLALKAGQKTNVAPDAAFRGQPTLPASLSARPSRASREHQFRGPADAWSKTPTTVPGPKYGRHRTRRSPFKILILNTYYRRSGFCPGEWRYLWLIYLRHEDHDHCVAANGGIRVKYTPIAPIRSLTHTPGRGRACANEGMRGRSRVQ